MEHYITEIKITAFFPANRKTQIIRARGVEDIRLSDAYDIYSQPGQFLHKYMIYLKTQQAYARNEGDLANADRIQKWFDRYGYLAKKKDLTEEERAERAKLREDERSAKL